MNDRVESILNHDRCSRPLLSDTHAFVDSRCLSVDLWAGKPNDEATASSSGLLPRGFDTIGGLRAADFSVVGASALPFACRSSSHAREFGVLRLVDGRLDLLGDLTALVGQIGPVL